MYSVNIDTGRGVDFGRSGLRDMNAVLEYVRGAMKVPPVPVGGTVIIDGPSADAGRYCIGLDRKLHRLGA